MRIQKVAVLVPFYKNWLSEFEKISLTQCGKVLGNYPIIAIKPQSLHLPDVSGFLKLTDIISFDDAYFKDIPGYNRLMLTPVFYSEFISYKHILIYQQDAFVFKDQLDFWCNTDLDYIGAPWIRAIPSKNIFEKTKLEIQYYYHARFDVQLNGLPTDKQFENKVGNGGLSLRNPKVFYNITLLMADKISEYLKKVNVHQYNEDMFWSVEVNRKRKVIKIGTLSQGLKFAFELYPYRAYILNKQQLPFGCHGWNLYLEFWRPIFKKIGYDI